MKRRNLLAGLAGLPFAAVAMSAPKAAAADPFLGDFPQGGEAIDQHRVPLFDMAAWDRCADDLDEHVWIGNPGDGPIYLGVEDTVVMGPLAIVAMQPMPSGRIRVRSHITISNASSAWSDPDAGPELRAAWLPHGEPQGGVTCVVNGPICRDGYFDASARKAAAEAFAVGLDPFSNSSLATDLLKSGVKLLDVPRARHAIGPVVQDIISMIDEGVITHWDDRMLRWMMANARTAEHPAGLPLPMKRSNTSPYSIAAVHALVNANAVRISHLRGELA